MGILLSDDDKQFIREQMAVADAWVRLLNSRIEQLTKAIQDKKATFSGEVK